jgi:hypothetical protein
MLVDAGAALYGIGGYAVSVLRLNSPGGRPGAGYLLLRGQKKLTEEKAALVPRY